MSNLNISADVSWITYISIKYYSLQKYHIREQIWKDLVKQNFFLRKEDIETQEQ